MQGGRLLASERTAVYVAKHAAMYGWPCMALPIDHAHEGAASVSLGLEADLPSKGVCDFSSAFVPLSHVGLQLGGRLRQHSGRSNAEAL